MKVKFMIYMLFCLFLLSSCGNEKVVNKSNTKEPQVISFSAGKKDSVSKSNNHTINENEKEVEPLVEDVNRISNEVREETVIVEKQNQSDVSQKIHHDTVVPVVKEENTVVKPTEEVPSKEDNQEIPKQDEIVENLGEKEEVKVEVFDVEPYIASAKDYATSIGLTLDSSAIDCWDNPISANSSKKTIERDINGRLDRYKNVDGCIGVWIWAEKISDNDYDIYIGYY